MCSMASHAHCPAMATRVMVPTKLMRPVAILGHAIRPSMRSSPPHEGPSLCGGMFRIRNREHATTTRRSSHLGASIRRGSNTNGIDAKLTKEVAPRDRMEIGSQMVSSLQQHKFVVFLPLSLSQANGFSDSRFPRPAGELWAAPAAASRANSGFSRAVRTAAEPALRASSGFRRMYAATSSSAVEAPVCGPAPRKEGWLQIAYILKMAFTIVSEPDKYPTQFPNANAIVAALRRHHQPGESIAEHWDRTGRARETEAWSATHKKINAALPLYVKRHPKFFRSRG